jgi:hypothetical protein
MRAAILIFASSTILVACGHNNDGTRSADDSGTPGYAYTIPHPDQWEWGDKNNIKIALNSLKAYENGNISAALKDYADTVAVQMDGFDGTLTKDSLTELFLRERNTIKRMAIKMNDFESVKSKDGKNEYVSLWYKQLWEDKNGKVDSVECMDDLAFKNGKIALINEKVRRFASSDLK